jgi:hypothetical protein
MLKGLVSAMVMTLLLHATFPGESVAADKTAAPAKPTPPVVKVGKGLVSVEARDAVLADLLHAIGKQAGVEVTIHSGGADRVTQSFAGVGLDDAIKLLAKGKDVVLVYSTATNKAGTNLVEVRLFAASAPGGRVVTQQGRGAAQSQAGKSMGDQTRQARPDGVASQVAKLTDADVTVRREAAMALATRPDKQAVGALRAAAEDQDAVVRTVALITLGQLLDDGSVGIMSQALLHDPEVNVRRAALSALSRLRTESARRAVQAAESDSDAGVSQAAADALRSWTNRPGTN